MASAFSTQLFQHNKLLKSFTAEASGLPGFTPDQWIGLKSHKTGQVLAFEPADCKRDDEGDVQYWTFRIKRSHAEFNRDLRGYTITVFND